MTTPFCLSVNVDADVIPSLYIVGAHDSLFCYTFYVALASLGFGVPGFGINAMESRYF